VIQTGHSVSSEMTTNEGKDNASTNRTKRVEQIGDA